MLWVSLIEDWIEWLKNKQSVDNIEDTNVVNHLVTIQFAASWKSWTCKRHNIYILNPVSRCFAISSIWYGMVKRVFTSSLELNTWFWMYIIHPKRYSRIPYVVEKLQGTLKCFLKMTINTMRFPGNKVTKFCGFSYELPMTDWWTVWTVYFIQNPEGHRPKWKHRHINTWWNLRINFSTTL